MEGPRLSSWFWDLLESAGHNLCALCRKLEELPQEQLERYRLEYDEAMGYVNPCYCEEFHPYLVDECSEDHCDDFAAWVVSQGREFYERVRSQPEAVQQHFDMFVRAETGRRSRMQGWWDDRVDRPEYRGYQRPDYIASPIYEMRFAKDLYEACYDASGNPRQEL